jgi:hypothetical protein
MSNSIDLYQSASLCLTLLSHPHNQCLHHLHTLSLYSLTLQCHFITYSRRSQITVYNTAECYVVCTEIVNHNWGYYFDIYAVCCITSYMKFCCCSFNEFSHHCCVYWFRNRIASVSMLSVWWLHLPVTHSFNLN